VTNTRWQTSARSIIIFAVRTFKRFDLENHCYFVTTNTQDRSPHFRPPCHAEIVVRNLQFYETRGDYALHGFVVMPDHMHLLIVPVAFPLSDCMRNVKSFVAKEMRDVTGVNGSIWQSSFHDRVVRGDRMYSNTLEYIHFNPVEAGLCKDRYDFPYSSARWYRDGTRGQGWGPDPRVW